MAAWARWFGPLPPPCIIKSIDVDLFCHDKNTLASPKGHTDYSSGCGYVDINLVDFGNDVFAGDKFNQHLSVYEGLESADGDGVKTRSLAWTDGDVIATEVDDLRVHPGTINIDLRMLRYAENFTGKPSPSPLGSHGAEIWTGDHVAISRLDIRDGKILLTQEFTEGKFYSAWQLPSPLWAHRQGVVLQRADGSFVRRAGPGQDDDPYRGRRQLRSQ